MAPILLALLLQAAPPAPRPSPDPREVRLERLQWSRTVDGPDPITAIEIRNDFGDIRARLAGDRVLDASMLVQRLDPGPQGVGFTVERRGSALALVVGYPPGRVKDADPRPPKDGYDRLDLTIFVPEGVTLRAHTLRGLVEARGLKGDVEAATLDGSILVSAAGVLQARTTRGEITATVSPAALAGPGAPLLFQSATGAINLIVPAQGSMELRVETAGAVTSKLDLQRATAGGRTTARATMGAGERLVLVTSGTGAVRIDR